MEQDKHVQLSLFSIGQGDRTQAVKLESTIESLKTRAETLNKEIQIARMEWDRLKSFQIEWREALRGTSHMKFVVIDNDRYARDMVLSVVRFLDSYQSKQCERAGKLLDILKLLHERGVEFDTSEKVDEWKGC